MKQTTVKQVERMAICEQLNYLALYYQLNEKRQQASKQLPNLKCSLRYDLKNLVGGVFCALWCS